MVQCRVGESCSGHSSTASLTSSSTSSLSDAHWKICRRDSGVARQRECMVHSDCVKGYVSRLIHFPCLEPLNLKIKVTFSEMQAEPFEEQVLLHEVSEEARAGRGPVQVRLRVLCWRDVHEHRRSHGQFLSPRSSNPFSLQKKNYVEDSSLFLVFNGIRYIP